MRLFKRRSLAGSSPSSLFKKRVAIQSPAYSSDGAGGYTVAWSDFHTVWAYIKVSSGNESFDDDRLRSRVRYRVIMRYVSGVTPEMRLTTGGKILLINAVIEDESHDGLLELICEERI